MAHQTRRRMLYALFPILGVCGFLLRAVQLRFGFTAAALPKTDFPPAAALAILTAAVLILAALLAQLLPPRDTRSLHHALNGFRHRTLLRLCAALIGLWGGAFLLFDLPGGVFPLLAAAFCFLTALCLLLLSSSPAYASLLLAEITCFSTGWLAVLFSRHASDPVLPSFWPPLLALCATSLSACFLTSAACGWPKPRRTVFVLLTGGALCLIALADCCAVAFSPRFFAYLAAALWQLHGAFCLFFSPKPQTAQRSI